MLYFRYVLRNAVQEREQGQFCVHYTNRQWNRESERYVCVIWAIHFHWYKFGWRSLKVWFTNLFNFTYFGKRIQTRYLKKEKEKKMNKPPCHPPTCMVRTQQLPKEHNAFLSPLSYWYIRTYRTFLMDYENRNRSVCIGQWMFNFYQKTRENVIRTFGKLNLKLVFNQTCGRMCFIKNDWRCTSVNYFTVSNK